MKNVRDDFGASTTNTPAQNTDAFLNAIAAGPFEIPDEVYVCDPIITSEPRIFMQGWGYGSTIVTPEFRVEVPVGNVGSRIRDLRISPVTAGSGSGLVIRQTADPGYFCEFEIDGVNVGQFAGAGLTLDNSIASSDGFFTGIIRHCDIYGQLNAIKIGDRITIEENVIQGGTLVGLQTTHVPGSRAVLIKGNTLVTRGGGLSVNGGEEVNIFFNQIEHPAYLGDYVGSLQTMVSLSNTVYCRMLYNRVNAEHGYAGPSGPCVGANYDLVIQNAGAHDNIADYNTWGPSKQSTRALIYAAGSGNVIGTNNRNN